MNFWSKILTTVLYIFAAHIAGGESFHYFKKAIKKDSSLYAGSGASWLMIFILVVYNYISTMGG